jgi:hypothetical protein
MRVRCSYALAKATGEQLLWKGGDVGRIEVCGIKSAPDRSRICVPMTT